MKCKTIAFCGIDGSGKSTQLNLVRDYLSENNLVYTSKINYSPLDNMGNNKLFDMIIKGMSGIEIMKYYLKIQNNQYKKYDYILFDRYLACYLAYAYAYGNSNLKFIRNILSMVKDSNLTIYYDVNVNIALERIFSRGDVTKSENYETLSRAKEGYEFMFDIIDNMYRIKADKSVQNVNDETIKVIQKTLK